MQLKSMITCLIHIKKETLPHSMLNHEIKIKNRLNPYTLESRDEISLMVPSNYDSNQLEITRLILTQ